MTDTKLNYQQLESETADRVLGFDGSGDPTLLTEVYTDVMINKIG